MGSRNCLNMKRVVLNYATPKAKQKLRLTFGDWVWGLTFAALALVVLAALATPRMGSRPAQKTAAKIYIEDMTTALDLFNRDNGRYPTTDEGLQALIANPANLPHWKPELYSTAPNPKIPSDPWGTPFIYRNPGMGKPYELFSAGPDGIAGTPDDILE